MTYLALFALLCALVPLGVVGGRKNTFLLCVVIAGLFLFVGFRWQVGCDWTSYRRIFDAAGTFSIEEGLVSPEPAFTLLNMAVHVLGLDQLYVNVVAAFLFFAGLYFFARRQGNPMAIVALSFPVLIINMPMSGIRQGIAIGLIMLAITAYTGRKRLPYVGSVLAASGFHQSALLFLGLTPLIGFRKTVATVALAVILALPALYFMLASTIGLYSERYGADTGDAAGAPYRAAMIAIVGLTFFAFLRRRWRQRFPDDYELFAIASLLMILVLPLTLYLSIVGDRLGYYLVPFQIVALERIPVLFREDRMAPIYSALPYVALLVFLGVWITVSTNFQACYVPYGSALMGIE